MQRITAKVIKNGPLTNREAQILKYMCEGFYCPEIAARLFRSIRTIEKHIENIAEKLDAHGSTEITLIVIELGLVEITLDQQ